MVALYRSKEREAPIDPRLKKLNAYPDEYVEQKRLQVLARLQIQHKNLKEMTRFLGDWNATEALLAQMAADKEIELHEGRYRPMGWVSAKPSGRSPIIARR